MALEQEGYRWRNDDGSETSATWMAAQDTAVSLPLNTTKRLRCIVNSVTTAPATSKYRLEYKEAAEAVWSEVKAGGGGKIVMAASSNITASGEVTTAQLTAPSGKTSGADFVAGRMWDDESGLDDVALAAGKYTEDEFSIQAVSANGAAVSDVYSFRLVYLEGASSIAPTPIQSKTNVTVGSANTKAITFDSSVVAGRLITFGAFIFLANNNTQALTAGMLTKTSGTSTIGTVQLDKQVDRADSDDDNIVGIFSVPVTGNGTLTLTLNLSTIVGAGSAFICISGVEWSNADVSGSRVNATNSSNATTGTAVASGNVATGGAGIIFGVMAPGTPYGNIVNTPDGAFTDYASVETDDPADGGVIARAVASNTTDSADWGLDTSSQWIAIAVAYKSSSP